MSETVEMTSLNETDPYFIGRVNPISEDSQSMTQSGKVRHVRYVYCSDGVVEECDEDEEEKRINEEMNQKMAEEEQRRLDVEAKNLPWMPWMTYMAKRNAEKGLQVCDFMGEKLAWWLGITKPKFFYEIEEYKRMKQEEEETARQNIDDIADEIVIGVDGKIVNLKDPTNCDNINFQIRNEKGRQGGLAAGQLFQNTTDNY